MGRESSGMSGLDSVYGRESLGVSVVKSMAVAQQQNRSPFLGFMKNNQPMNLVFPPIFRREWFAPPIFSLNNNVLTPTSVVQR